MTIFLVFSILVVLCSLASFVNVKYFNLPTAIALLIFSVLISIALLISGHFSETLNNNFQLFVEKLDLSNFLMQNMLCFLLFAGALHVDLKILKELRWAVITFTLVGVLTATFLVGYLLYWVSPLLGFQIPLIYCLLFGGLISPTDPIAVLGILKEANVPKSEEVIITGESLFNDGVGVIIFVTILQLITTAAPVSFSTISHVFLMEVVGGLALGVVLGYIGNFFVGAINHYKTEVMITLAIVMGGYSLAAYLHTSGPLAMVVAGLIVGNYGRENSMTISSRQYIDTFWELIDELLNAFLFVMIGLKMAALDLKSFFLIGLIAIVITLFARYISIVIPFWLFRFNKKFKSSFPLIMTWGGLRGGISIALALSLPDNAGIPHEIRIFIISIVYIIVLFSIIVQGLSLEKLVYFFKNRS